MLQRVAQCTSALTPNGVSLRGASEHRPLGPCLDAYLSFLSVALCLNASPSAPAPSAPIELPSRLRTTFQPWYPVSTPWSLASPRTSANPRYYCAPAPRPAHERPEA